MKAINLSYKSLILISIPSAAATSVELLAELVDTAFIGRLGVEPLSALSACNAVFSVTFWVFNFLLHVGNAELANAVGQSGNSTSKNSPNLKIETTIKLGIKLGIIVGVFVTSLLFFTRSLFLESLMELDSVRLALATEYYNTRLWGTMASFLALSCVGMLRGLQRLHLCFYIVLAQTLFNIGLTFYLVQVQALGLFGAAMGTSVAQILTAIFCVWFILKHYCNTPKKNWFSAPQADIKNFVTQSMHQFFRTLGLSSTFLVAAALTNRESALAGSTHQILLQFWLLNAYLLDGIAITATSLGGKLAGSKLYNDWKILSQRLMIIATGIGLGFSLLYYLYPECVFWFVTDKAIFIETQKIWLILILFQIPNAILFVQDGLAFSLREFALVKRVIWRGLFIGYLPALYLTQANFGVLVGVWVANASLNFLRLTQLSWFLKSPFQKP